MLANRTFSVCGCRARMLMVAYCLTAGCSSVRCLAVFCAEMFSVVRTNNKPTDIQWVYSGAQDRTRTCTLSLALVPETSVSTNSTTWAWLAGNVRFSFPRTVCKYKEKSESHEFLEKYFVRKCVFSCFDTASRAFIRFVETAARYRRYRIKTVRICRRHGKRPGCLRSSPLLSFVRERNRRWPEVAKREYEKRGMFGPSRRICGVSVRGAMRVTL